MSDSTFLPLAVEPSATGTPLEAAGVAAEAEAAAFGVRARARAPFVVLRISFRAVGRNGLTRQRTAILDSRRSSTTVSSQGRSDASSRIVRRQRAGTLRACESS
jgi:hypothetical protein